MRAFLNLADWVLTSTRKGYLGAFIFVPMLAWVLLGFWPDRITGLTSLPGIAAGIHIAASCFIYGRTLHLQGLEYRRNFDRRFYEVATGDGSAAESFRRNDESAEFLRVLLSKYLLRVP